MKIKCFYEANGKFYKELEAHRERVRDCLDVICNSSLFDYNYYIYAKMRGFSHDISKKSRAEKNGHVLKIMYEDNPELKKTLEDIRAMKKTDKIHITMNRHHPEHYKDINDMKYVDIVDMLANIAANSDSFKSFTDYINKVLFVKYNFNRYRTGLILNLSMVYKTYI